MCEIIFYLNGRLYIVCSNQFFCQLFSYTSGTISAITYRKILFKNAPIQHQKVESYLCWLWWPIRKRLAGIIVVCQPKIYGYHTTMCSELMVILFSRSLLNKWSSITQTYILLSKCKEFSAITCGFSEPLMGQFFFLR